MKLLSILTFAVAVSAIKCGKTTYTEEQVKLADEAACKHVQEHTKAGKYPHVYKNHEKFKFKGLGGPFYEFPLKKTPYKGDKLPLSYVASREKKKRKRKQKNRAQ
ncbi:hypothetical protein TRV_04362 [Trichophyton verrucosum HKI 0517]|uniref:Uncharacterized protein n=1 Tax=Trichophyton verrucosum (strain HKI 0517) TaxID=663202 RepID=D4DB63_TRIVH|nr:uncharacterized protein TRV_04362 [Trichophyton verrucosum HKI 0517]EFE40897.1 hypothetical protein TRV_04362 [Trichophyton verrucosum HKI 0517]